MTAFQQQQSSPSNQVHHRGLVTIRLHIITFPKPRLQSWSFSNFAPDLIKRSSSARQLNRMLLQNSGTNKLFSYVAPTAWFVKLSGHFRQKFILVKNVQILNWIFLCAAEWIHGTWKSSYKKIAEHKILLGAKMSSFLEETEKYIMQINLEMLLKFKMMR